MQGSIFGTPGGNRTHNNALGGHRNIHFTTGAQLAVAELFWLMDVDQSTAHNNQVCAKLWQQKGNNEKLAKRFIKNNCIRVLYF